MFSNYYYLLIIVKIHHSFSKIGDAWGLGGNSANLGNCKLPLLRLALNFLLKVFLSYLPQRTNLSVFLIFFSVWAALTTLQLVSTLPAILIAIIITRKYPSCSISQHRCICQVKPICDLRWVGIPNVSAIDSRANYEWPISPSGGMLSLLQLCFHSAAWYHEDKI